MISHNQRGAAKSPGDLACAAVLEGSEASLQTLGGWSHLGAICAFESNQEQLTGLDSATTCHYGRWVRAGPDPAGAPAPGSVPGPRPSQPATDLAGEPLTRRGQTHPLGQVQLAAAAGCC